MIGPLLGEVEVTAPRRRLLLVEDEPSLVLILSDRLVAEGYEVETAGDGARAVDLALGSSFDLIVLDVMLPGGMDGFDVCRELRQGGVQVPILMLTARSQVVDRVVGLKLGADDYVTKPFEAIELLARIEALLRRARTPVADAGGTYAFGSVRIDFRRAEVTRDGEPVALSAMEYKLLVYFIRHRGAALSRDELLDKVWGYDAMPTTRTVDVHVASLRQKLERHPSRPEHIVTVHRLGYRFAG
jgi:two-component system alkaline phosphatase synthesis response regulator PhoP